MTPRKPSKPKRPRRERDPAWMKRPEVIQGMDACGLEWDLSRGPNDPTPQQNLRTLTKRVSELESGPWLAMTPLARTFWVLMLDQWPKKVLRVPSNVVVMRHLRENPISAAERPLVVPAVGDAFDKAVREGVLNVQDMKILLGAAYDRLPRAAIVNIATLLAHKKAKELIRESRDALDGIRSIIGGPRWDLAVRLDRYLNPIGSATP